MKKLLVCGTISLWASCILAQNGGGWPGSVKLSSFPDIEVFGCLGTNYQIQSSTNLRNWKDEATITLLSNPTTWCDTEGMQPRKFYRAMGPDPVQDPGNSATNQCLILPPIPCNTNQSYPLVMYFHGSGEDENSVLVGQPTNVTWAIRTNGFYVCAAFAGMYNWGNGDACTNYMQFADWCMRHLNCNRKLVWWSASMGGVSGLLTARYRTNYVVGWMGTYPVCSLSNLYSLGTYTADIRAAYGIAADGSDYAIKTAGHDPMLLPPGNWDGLRMHLWASYGDTVVPRSENADALKSLADGHATEDTTVTTTGNHGDPSNYDPQIPDLLAFLKRCTQ
jgi:hypothetical protein